MNEKYTEFNKQVELGAQLCIKLKQIYYENASGFESYRAVADKITQLKKRARLIYKHMTEIEMLQTLRIFDNDGLKEFMEDESILPTAKTMATHEQKEET